ncbi:MAG TPA: rhomboid family intramembrane serine protease [Iamia sp.]|nr:rhomboid family intramembrane serine protease [Iamia sp.]
MGTDDEPLSDLLRPFVLVGLVVAAMWVSEGVDLVLPGQPLNRWGIRPRSARGVLGIPLAPFLHDGLRHLFANTIPFLVMGGAIAAGSIGRFVRVAAIVGVTSGVGVWLFARGGTTHLGASGLVFGFLTYLLARGVIARKASWMLGGLVVLLVYGGILWGLLPRPGISWTGHVFGAAGGVLAAWVLHRRTPDTAL